MSAVSKKKLLSKLKNKAYRDAYVAEHIKTSLPVQIRLMREKKGWSQEQLAHIAKTTQTAISRIEDPNYGNLTISSLLKLSSAFDVALLIKFVPFSKLLSEFRSVSSENITPDNFETEIDFMEKQLSRFDGTDNIITLNEYILPINSAASHFEFISPNKPKLMVRSW